MSRPVTRAKNSNQHPGQIVLDTIQKHRTSEQKRQDDTRKEREKHEQQSVQAHTIKRVAEIISEGTQAEKDLLTARHQPKPRKAPLSQRLAVVTHGE